MSFPKPILFFITAAIISGCDSKADAPFSTHWNAGEQQYDFKSLPSFQSLPQSDGRNLIYVTAPPSGSLGKGEYRFYFSGNKLNQIIYRTYDISGSDSEDSAKARYQELKLELTKLYGVPVGVNEHVYNKNFEFFPCITNKYCGEWSSEFANGTTKALLSIGMGKNGSGYAEDRIAGSVSIEFSKK
ncbi:hypothetical protein V2154_16745 [Ewingella sp. CoE-038-23]|uniref:hypothetical protein n=1 Tax=Ewingella docleensis TaxID=3118588 RepID=UPI0033653AF7